MMWDIYIYIFKFSSISNRTFLDLTSFSVGWLLRQQAGSVELFSHCVTLLVGRRVGRRSAGFFSRTTEVLHVGMNAVFHRTRFGAVSPHTHVPWPTCYLAYMYLELSQHCAHIRRPSSVVLEWKSLWVKKVFLSFTWYCANILLLSFIIFEF